MKVWLPYINSGGGSDIFVLRLAASLERLGVEVVRTKLHRLFEILPLSKGSIHDADLILAPALIAYRFRGLAPKLVAIEHHCVFDSDYSPYTDSVQKFYHQTLLKTALVRSLTYADAVVTPSEYTRNSLAESLGFQDAITIYNGIDTRLFQPGPRNTGTTATKRLLFTGNLIKRKGADLLGDIMDRLGPDYHLYCTSGLRSKIRLKSRHNNISMLGTLEKSALIKEYQESQALLFPTRFEGFGYTVAEAMACGKPVVTTNCSSLPELVDHNENGILCERDCIDDYVESLRDLFSQEEKLARYGVSARQKAVSKFDIDQMGQAYLNLFNELLCVDTSASMSVPDTSQ